MGQASARIAFTAREVVQGPSVKIVLLPAVVDRSLADHAPFLDFDEDLLLVFVRRVRRGTARRR